MSFNKKIQEATEYAQKRNYEESIKKFKEALELTNDDNDKAMCLASIGKIISMQAVNTIADSSRITTNTPPKISYDNELFNEAIKYFNRAIELKPDSGFIHENKALALARKGDFENAIKYGLTAVEIDSSNLIIISNIVKWYKDSEKFHEAIEYSKKILHNRGKIIQMYKKNPTQQNKMGLRCISGTLMNKAVAQFNLKNKVCLELMKNAIDFEEEYNLGNTEEFHRILNSMKQEFQI